MERSWVYAVVGAAALLVVVVGIKHQSNSDSPESGGALSSRPQVASLPDRARSEKGGWIARPGGPDETGAGPATQGSGLQGGGSAGAGGMHGTGGVGAPASGKRGADVFIDRGGSGPGSGGSGVGVRSSGGTGGDAIQVGSGVPALDAPFEGARPITGPGGGQMTNKGSHETVQQTADKSGDNSKPVPDGQPVLSLPFDKSTQPENTDTAVFDQGVTFDSGQGAVFSTDSQFVVPNGGNLQGDGGAISMWVQPGWAGGDESNASLAQLRNPNQWEDRLQIFKNGVYMRFVMADSTGQESNIGTNISDWAPGDWHNVVASWGQNENGQLVQSFYIDGKLIGQAPIQGQFNIRPGTPLYIGSDMPQGIPGANGAISQFKAYGSPATPDLVSTLSSQRPN